MSYYQKYLKYKSKYLELKQSNKLQYGGDKPIIRNVNKINLFTDPEMEQYLNPIYGMILCNNGYITNNYLLNINKFINTEESKTIRKVCNQNNGILQPTNDILKLDPIVFGRYIAIKYINMKHSCFDKSKKTGKLVNTEGVKNINVNTIDLSNINTYTELKRFIPIEKNELIYFHLILYCCWWCSNNDEGIVQYYQGINEVFQLFNKYFREGQKYELINLESISANPNSFEQIVFKILNKPFKIYNQEWAKRFCTSQDTNTYPDCGESTFRNFINLLCIKNNEFNLEILRNLGAIDQLIEYYQKFNNFDLQSNPNRLIMIYGENLNARNAWSKLIIDYCSTNINFNKHCDSGKGYELNAGLSLNGETSNFLQLLKNLFEKKTEPIENLSDLKTEFIKDIIDDTHAGIGEISISHELLGDFKIYCQPRHFYMEYIVKIRNDTSDDFSELSPSQQEIINILSQNESILSASNYLLFDYTSDFLANVFNNNTNNEIKKNLFILSLTNNYDSDLRSRLIVDVDEEYFIDILDNHTDILINTNINEYIYKCNDFEFVRKIPSLINLNSVIKNNDAIQTIDLSPLINVKHVDNFLNKCYELKNIDLSGLSNLTSIGNNFMAECYELENIDLSGLSNLTTIGNNFMIDCESLENINLSGLSNLISIGNNFMNSCKKLDEIDLSGLSNLTSIGFEFMKNCRKLVNINLSGLSNLTSIEDNFLHNCKLLTNIDLSGLTNLKSIKNFYLFGCNSLISINLFGLTNLVSIGDYFLTGCKIISIDLSSLINLKSIGNDFFSSNNSLININLSGLSNLISIENNFLNNCSKLTNIDLSGLSNLTSIQNNFLSNCSELTNIDLSGLSNLTSIGNNFLSDCSELTDINLSGLSKVTIIHSNFLTGCKIISIDLSSLTNLKSIGYDFLSSNNSLINIDLSGLSNLTGIGENFLSECDKLEKIKCTEKQKELIKKIRSFRYDDSIFEI